MTELAANVKAMTARGYNARAIANRLRCDLEEVAAILDPPSAPVPEPVAAVPVVEPPSKAKPKAKPKTRKTVAAKPKKKR